MGQRMSIAKQHDQFDSINKAPWETKWVDRRVWDIGNKLLGANAVRNAYFHKCFFLGKIKILPELNLWTVLAVGFLSIGSQVNRWDTTLIRLCGGNVLKVHWSANSNDTAVARATGESQLHPGLRQSLMVPVRQCYQTNLICCTYMVVSNRKQRWL